MGWNDKKMRVKIEVKWLFRELDSDVCYGVHLDKVTAFHRWGIVIFLIYKLRVVHFICRPTEAKQFGIYLGYLAFCI